MTMRIQKGNLLDAAVMGDVSIIMHGANCFHKMGSGIAGEIARRFPQIPDRDRRTVYGAPGKLGDFSLAAVTQENIPAVQPRAGWVDKPERFLVTLDKPFQCINLYTQFTPGPDFIASIFPNAINHINEVFAGDTIGLPLIGCGIGGGDWEAVMNTLLTDGKDVNWAVYVL